MIRRRITKLFSMTAAIYAVFCPAILLPAFGGAVGNPSPANGWRTTSAVSVTASSSKGSRPVIRTIDGSGIDISGELHRGSASNGQPGPYMWLSESYSTPVSRPGAVPGSHWIQFAFNGVKTLGSMWIWNYNEKPNDWTIQGTKEATIQYSATGRSSPSHWFTAYDGLIQKASEWLPEASPWNTPVSQVIDFAGAQARYVVITADLGTERNWAGGGPGELEVGLSEVRFYTFSFPAFSVVDLTGRTGLAFQSVLGAIYRPEFAPAASPSNWNGMGFSLAGNGGQMFAFDPSGYSEQRVYRIVREP